MRAVGALALAVTLGACGLGSWTTEPTPSPVRAIHAALLRDGRVLLVAGSGNDPATFAAGTFRSAVWDPTTGTFTDVTTPYDMFCAGHAALPDGRLLVAGGTLAYPDAATDSNYAGSREAYTFDPATTTYTKVPDLDEGHWYPTLVSLGDGRVLTVAGLDDHRTAHSTFQVFDAAGNGGTGSWTPQQTSVQFFPSYPALHLMADGRLFFSGVTTFGVGNVPPGIWDAAANTFQPVAGLPDPERRGMGASVLLPPAQDQRVLVMGGGQHNDLAVPATASTAVIDLDAPSPAFVAGPPLGESKMYVSAVILPDRTVLQTGGANASSLGHTRPEFRYRSSAQIYHPDTNTFTGAMASTVGRVYHSEALLLPDGRVATFGGNASDRGDPFEMRIEVFTPDYAAEARPTLTVEASQTQVTRGGSLTFSADRPLRWVELVRPSAVTHSLDPDQRLVDLPFVQTGGQVAAQLDANPNLTPPGWYMLFGVDAANVPSVATWVHVS